MSRSDDGVVSTTVDIAPYGRAIKALFHFISFQDKIVDFGKYFRDLNFTFAKLGSTC